MPNGEGVSGIQYERGGMGGALSLVVLVVRIDGYVARRAVSGLAAHHKTADVGMVRGVGRGRVECIVDASVGVRKIVVPILLIFEHPTDPLHILLVRFD